MHTCKYTQLKINKGDMARDPNKACYIAEGLTKIVSFDFQDMAVGLLCTE